MRLKRILAGAALAVIVMSFPAAAAAEDGVMPIGTKLDGFSMKDPAGK